MLCCLVHELNCLKCSLLTFILIVNLLIEKQHSREKISRGAMLLSVRPLIIGLKSRIHIFKK